MLYENFKIRLHFIGKKLKNLTEIKNIKIKKPFQTNKSKIIHKNKSPKRIF